MVLVNPVPFVLLTESRDVVANATTGVMSSLEYYIIILLIYELLLKRKSLTISWVPGTHVIFMSSFRFSPASFSFELPFYNKASKTTVVVYCIPSGLYPRSLISFFFSILSLTPPSFYFCSIAYFIVTRRKIPTCSFCNIYIGPYPG